LLLIKVGVMGPSRPVAGI